MAEYSEVIKQFKRMCKSISAAKCTRGECPMGREFGCENIGQCRKIAFERYADFEKLVMAWAAENPELVYPTWAEWLMEHGLVYASDDSAYMKRWFVINQSGIEKPIPADIAQKLAIKPKE